MKTAIICYDLKNVGTADNSVVKTSLSQFINTRFSLAGLNILNPIPQWVRLSFPDTTFLADVPDDITSIDLIDHVREVIASANAEADRVFVAFIEPDTHYLYNSLKNQETPAE